MAKKVRNGLTQKQRKTRNKRGAKGIYLYFIRPSPPMRRNWKEYPYGTGGGEFPVIPPEAVWDGAEAALAEDHEYLSTACLHGYHDHCRSDVNIQGKPKVPGQCKWCSAMCICSCHKAPESE